jgi:hypothetical protein
MFTLTSVSLIFLLFPLFPFVVANIYLPFFDLGFWLLFFFFFLPFFNEFYLKKKRRKKRHNFRNLKIYNFSKRSDPQCGQLIAADLSPPSRCARGGFWSKTHQRRCVCVESESTSFIITIVPILYFHLLWMGF